jgi:hypothetical protein
MKTSFEKFMASSAVQEVSKVEMSTVKVDLAIVDDLIKENKNAQRDLEIVSMQIKELIEFERQVRLAKIALENNISAAINFTSAIRQREEKLSNLLAVYEKSSKELGIQPNSNKEYGFADKTLSMITPKLRSLQGAIKSAQEIIK